MRRWDHDTVRLPWLRTCGGQDVWMRRWDHDTVRLPWLMTSRHRQCRLKSKLHTEKCDAIHCWIRGMPKQRLCKTGVSMAWLRCEASKLPPREPRRQARQLASDHIIGIILGLAKLGPGCTGSHRVGSELIRLSLLTSRSHPEAPDRYVVTQ